MGLIICSQDYLRPLNLILSAKTYELLFLAVLRYLLSLNKESYPYLGSQNYEHWQIRYHEFLSNYLIYNLNYY